MLYPTRNGGRRLESGMTVCTRLLGVSQYPAALAKRRVCRWPATIQGDLRLSAFSNHWGKPCDSMGRQRVITTVTQPAIRQQIQSGRTMKNLFVFLVLSTVCISLGLETLSQAHSTPDVVRVVQSKFKAFNEHDVSAIEHIYAADAVLHSPDYPQLAGNTAIAGTYKSLFDAIPDARDTVQNIIGSDDKVIVEFVLTGHFGGAENKPVNARIVSIYTVKHAHIIADSTYYDRKQ